MEKDKLVRIVIPVYRSELKPFEQAALSNNMEKLGHYPVVFLTPESCETCVPPRKDMRICTFLWIYYGFPASTYEGLNVEDARYRCGRYCFLRTG